MVILSGKQCFGFELSDVGVRSGKFASQILKQVLALLGVRFRFRQFDISFDIADERGELGVRSELVFRALALFQNRLGFFLITPKIGIGDALFGCS